MGKKKLLSDKFYIVLVFSCGMKVFIFALVVSLLLIGVFAAGVVAESGKGKRVFDRDSSLSPGDGDDSKARSNGRIRIERRIVDEKGEEREVKIRIEEMVGPGGEIKVRRKIKIEGDDETEFEAETELEIEDDEGEVKVKLSNGNKQGIKVMPDRASEIAIERLRSMNISVELREVGQRSRPRAIYVVDTNKTGRFLGIFKMKLKVSTEIDPETGEVIRVKKPLLAFLISGEDSDETLGDKVVICHVPRGNPENAHTIVVGSPAARAHLRHGDSLDSCEGDSIPPGNETLPGNETGNETGMPEGNETGNLSA
jgi:hypothetical protein